MGSGLTVKIDPVVGPRESLRKLRQAGNRIYIAHHVTVVVTDRQVVRGKKIDGRYPAHASKLSILPANNEAHPERISC